MKEGFINARIVCSAKGVPEPTFRWENSDGELISQGRSLNIKKGVSRAESGAYTCVAR